MDKKQYWTDQIEAQSKSGQTRHKYCESRELNFHTFTYWKQKIFGSKKVTGKKKFVAVKIKPSSVLSYELELSNGHKVRFDNFDVSKLQQIIELLK